MNGSVWAESTEITFSTWCWNTNRNWPHESVKCDIQIQLDHFANVTLKPLDKSFHIAPTVEILNFILQFEQYENEN